MHEIAKDNFPSNQFISTTRPVSLRELVMSAQGLGMVEWSRRLLGLEDLPRMTFEEGDCWPLRRE